MSAFGEYGHHHRHHHNHQEFTGHHHAHGHHPVNLVHEHPSHFSHIPKLSADHFQQRHDPSSNGVDLRPRMPPVFNQGQIGSCTANALCAAFAYDDPSLLGSRLFVYYNERMMENTINEDGGAVLSDGVEALHTYGLCKESSWPYSDDGKFRERPADHCYHEAVQHEAASYHQVETSEEGIKAALTSGYPIVLGIKLYKSFESPDVTSTGYVPLPDTDNEQCLGGHAVVMVGYDESQRVWIMRNSWGPDWGDGGHFYLPYEYITDASLGLCPGDLWVICKVTNAPVSDPPVAIKPHRKHQHHHEFHF